MRQSTLFFHPYVFSKKISRMTFAISPVFAEDGTLTTLLVGHSACSVKDQFCKKIGRELALNHTPVEVPLKELHQYIHDVIYKAEGHSWDAKPTDYAFLTLSFI